MFFTKVLCAHPAQGLGLPHTGVFREAGLKCHQSERAPKAGGRERAELLGAVALQGREGLSRLPQPQGPQV